MARGLKFRIYKVESSGNILFMTCPAGIDVTPIHIFDTETLIRKI